MQSYIPNSTCKIEKVCNKKKKKGVCFWKIKITFTKNFFFFFLDFSKE